MASAERAPYFYAAEVDVYQPATTTQSYALGANSRPANTLTIKASSPASSDTLRVSDAGYRTRSTDPGGVLVYPGVLQQTFAFDRHVALPPTQTSTYTYGTVSLSNLGRRYDDYVATRNVDSRNIKLLIGQKAWDAARGIPVDPAYATLTSLFAGTAGPWTLSEETLDIPLQGPDYWADRPLQSNLYTGAGGLNGGTDLTGKPIPMSRGGTSSFPIQQVSLVLVDATNLIYQYTDAPGTVVTLYEGGAAVFAYDGDVSDLYSGTAPSPGHYRTNNTRGLLQMGSRPFGSFALTADVTGAFSAAGAISTAAGIARYLLTETMGLPSTMIDTTSFTTADTAYPYTSGIYIGTAAVSGLTTVQGVLGSLGASLIGSRAGKLGVFVLRTTTSGATPVIKLSTGNAVACKPVALPAELDPPPYRWRVGYQQNYTVQSGNLNGALTAARVALLAEQSQYATWSGASVLVAFRRPSDPNPVQTALLKQADASTLANALGDLWDGPPNLYAVEVPINVAVSVDIGSIVLLTWPLRDLIGGKIGQVVGEQTTSYSATSTLHVLVTA